MYIYLHLEHTHMHIIIFLSPESVRVCVCCCLMSRLAQEALEDIKVILSSAILENEPHLVS